MSKFCTGEYLPNINKIIIRRKRIRRYFPNCITRAIIVTYIHEFVHRLQWFLLYRKNTIKWNNDDDELEKLPYFIDGIFSKILNVQL